MNKDTVYREDVLNVLKLYGYLPLDDLYYAIEHDLPSADSEVVGKLKNAIESEEICKSCPTAERISGENLLGAMALGFSYGMDADRPQEWIPCSERLPEDIQIGDEYPTVIFCTKESTYAGFHECYLGGRWWSEDDDCVVHGVIAWMPLPKPWKGADDEDN